MQVMHDKFSSWIMFNNKNETVHFSFLLLLLTITALIPCFIQAVGLTNLFIPQGT